MRSEGCRISTIAVGLVLALSPHLLSQESGAADPAPQAYVALKAGDLGRAVSLLEAAVARQPSKISLRKDLAYTLLKTGRTAEARTQFGEVVKLDPTDSYAALEYAFLCHETGRLAEAYALFRALGNTENPEHRQTARQVFSKMDQELLARIQRLRAAAASDPSDYGSHLELARAAAIRNDYETAAPLFQTAYQLKPQYPEVLLELADAWRKAGDEEKSKAALLAASRGNSAFVAEQAAEQLPARYPFLYEFENAVALSPENAALRREMAFFLISLGRAGDALPHFRDLVRRDAKDFVSQAQLGFLLLERGERDAALDHLHVALETEDTKLRARVEAALRKLAASQSGAAQQTLTPPAATKAKLPDEQPLLAAPVASPSASSPSAPAPDFTSAAEAREMGRKSFEKGYLPDAIRYYREAHDLDPTDFDTILRLAWSLNTAGRDQEAIQWFFLAARSPEPEIALDANKALMNLTAPAASGAAMARSTPERHGIVASLWAMPLHSTRWGSTFAYAQAKAELMDSRLPVVPYASLRFVGDTTGAVGGANPQFLSENAFILGLGARTRPWNGMLVWAEAGSAMAYLGSRRDQSGSFVPDYRGGLSHFHLFGPSVQAERPGWFAETMNDLVYIHRFDRDTLAISRNRVGWHLGKVDGLGGLQFQAYFNLNANLDFKRQAWANFVEAGPGVRFRWNWLPPPVSFTFNYLRGTHTIRRADGRPNTYTDFQAGLWYAYSR